MGTIDREVDVAKRAKVIEWLKTELLDQTARLFKGIWEGSQDKVKDSLASLVTACYVLARRLGVSYQELDAEVVRKANQHMQENHSLEEWYRDLSAVEQHFRKR